MLYSNLQMCCISIILINCILMSGVSSRGNGGGKGGVKTNVKRRKNRYSHDDLPNSQNRGGSHDGTNEQKLLGKLFRDYDTDARGVVFSNQTVTVNLTYILLRIQSLDERSQVLTHTGLIITDWHDQRLQWNPTDYDNLTDIVVHPLRIWQPELALMNGADEQAPDFRRIRALIRYTGEVHWEPGGIFMTTCDIDIRYFPFDEQECPILIGAWAYYSARMNLTNSTNNIPMHSLKMNGEWEVYGTEAVWNQTILPCCPDTKYSYVEFKIFLRRRYTFYIMNIILPCSLLSVLVMIVFCLPPDAGEKISLGISVLLAFTVFLLMVAENVPRTSLRVPVMVIYLTITMALGTCSVCLTVFVLNLHHRHIENKVPHWAKVVVLKHLSRLLCMTPRRPLRPKNMLDNSELSIRDGIRRIAQDMHSLNPMLTPNGRDAGDNSRYRGGTAPLNHTTSTDTNRYRSGPYSNTVNHTVTAGGRIVNSTHETNSYSTHHPNHHHRPPNHIPHENSLEYVNEWRELAHVLDRLFFWIVFVFMTLSTIVIILTPTYQNRKLPPQGLNNTVI